MRRSSEEESKIERGEVNEGTCAAEEWEWKNVKDKKWGGEMQVGGGVNACHSEKGETAKEGEKMGELR